MTPVTVDAEWLVERVARRVVELLGERDQDPHGLVDAATLARLLGVSRTTIYDRASELGALQLGESTRPRLRFDPVRAREAWATRHSTEQPAVPAPAEARRRSKRARSAGSVRLLPVKGREAA